MGNAIKDPTGNNIALLQAKIGAKPDGYFGPETIQKMRDYVFPNPVETYIDESGISSSSTPVSAPATTDQVIPTIPSNGYPENNPNYLATAPISETRSETLKNTAEIFSQEIKNFLKNNQIAFSSESSKHILTPNKGIYNSDSPITLPA